MVISLDNLFIYLFSVIPQIFTYELILKCRFLLDTVGKQVSDKNHGTSHICPLTPVSHSDLLEVINLAPSRLFPKVQLDVLNLLQVLQAFYFRLIVTVSLSWWQISINAQISLLT